MHEEVLVDSSRVTFKRLSPHDKISEAADGDGGDQHAMVIRAQSSAIGMHPGAKGKSQRRVGASQANVQGEELW